MVCSVLDSPKAFLCWLQFSHVMSFAFFDSHMVYLYLLPAFRHLQYPYICLLHIYACLKFKMAAWYGVEYNSLLATVRFLLPFCAFNKIKYFAILFELATLHFRLFCVSCKIKFLLNCDKTCAQSCVHGSIIVAFWKIDAWLAVQRQCGLHQNVRNLICNSSSLSLQLSSCWV